MTDSTADNPVDTEEREQANRPRTRPPRPRPQQPREPEPLTNMPPDHVGILIAALVMAVAGLLGLYWLVTTQTVGLGPQIWAFFLFLHLSVTGIALPAVRFINVRLTPLDRDVPPGGVIVRQSVWIGLFVVICAWLQIPRALSLPVAFFVALVFTVLEGFLRMRELNSDDE
jgi:hypothetical protein